MCGIKIAAGWNVAYLGVSKHILEFVVIILLKFGTLIYRYKAVCEICECCVCNRNGWLAYGAPPVRPVRLLLNEIIELHVWYGGNVICFRLDGIVNISMFFFFSCADQEHVSRIFDFITSTRIFLFLFSVLCTIISQCKHKIRV